MDLGNLVHVNQHSRLNVSARRRCYCRLDPIHSSHAMCTTQRMWREVRCEVGKRGGKAKTSSSRVKEQYITGLDVDAVAEEEEEKCLLTENLSQNAGFRKYSLPKPTFQVAPERREIGSDMLIYARVWNVKPFALLTHMASVYVPHTRAFHPR